MRVDDGLARVRGDELPRRLAESMRERLDRLSADACQVVRVAAVLGTRFTAEQLAAVLDRRPSQLLEPIDETLRVDLLSEAGERLGFRHELLRQAVLRTLPRSVLRGLRREAARRAARARRRGRPGRRAARRQRRAGRRGRDRAAARAAHTLAATDAAAAADMSVRALELTPPGDADHSALGAETMAALHAAMRDEEASRLAASVLDGTLPDEEEAEIRLSLSSRLIGRDRVRGGEPPGAAAAGVSPRLRAQHLGWLDVHAGELRAARRGRAAARPRARGGGGGRRRLARAMASIGQISCLLQRGRLRGGARSHRLSSTGSPAQRRPRGRAHGRVPARRRARRARARGRVAAAPRDGLERGRRERQRVARARLGRDSARTCTSSPARSRTRRPTPRRPSRWAQRAGVARRRRFRAARALPGRAAHRRPRPDARVGRLARRCMRESRGQPWRAPARRVDAGAGRDAGWRPARGGTLARPGSAVANGPVTVPCRTLAPTFPPPRRSDGSRRSPTRPPPDTGGVLPYAVPAFPSDPAYLRAGRADRLAAGDRRTRAQRAVARRRGGRAREPGRAVARRGRRPRPRAPRRRRVRAGPRRRPAPDGGRPLPHASALEDAGRALGDVDRLAAALELYNTAGATADAARVATRLRGLGVRQATDRAAPDRGLGEPHRVRAAGRPPRRPRRDQPRRRRAPLPLPHTVSSHLRHAFAKLRINSRIELARLLHEHDAPAVA